MRMDADSNDLTAADVVNSFTGAQLAQIIKEVC